MPHTPQTHEHDPRWTSVDTYTLSHLHPDASKTALPNPSSLALTLQNSAVKGLPDIAVSPSQGKFLKLQAQFLNAKSILEIGTLGGYSTIWLASASEEVKVVSVEVDEFHAEVARENIGNAGYGDRVEVKIGAGVDVLEIIAKEVESGARERFDLVFIDADKENNWNYVDRAVGLSRKGAAIIVDNVVRKGKLAKRGTGDPSVEGARRVVEKVGKNERLDGVVLQTVGEKNYDGFLIAVVK